MWHGSSAGLAYKALNANSSSPVPEDIHSPETRSQKAWLECYKEIQTNSPCKQLIGIYLASLSGTGTVDRFLKLVVRVKDYRPGLDPRGATAAVKLLCQDLGGRRRQPLQARELLVDATARVAAGGGGVAHPMTKFGLRSQTIYKNLFGERRLPGRSVEVLLPQEVAKRRLAADRPRMSHPRKSSSSRLSEAAALQEHADSVHAAVKRVREGGEADGPLGVIQLPEPEAKKKRVMQEAAQAANTAMATGRALVPEHVPADAYVSPRIF